MSLKLAFATDHTAAEIRDSVKSYLENSGYQVKDLGFSGQGICDYPDYAKKAAEEIVEGKVDKGVLICGTGIGMSIAANKIKGIIAAVCWDENSAKLAAQHNCANIICLGARTASVGDICRRIEIFLKTPFEKRHSPRIEKITQLEK